MDTLTHKELSTILANFKGTTFINIHSVTPNKAQFNEGQNGSKKAIDKMSNILGWHNSEIMKETDHNFMLTSCSFDTMIERARNRQFDKELEFLGIDVDSFIKSMSFFRKDNYVLSERMNGTSVNPYLVMSSKDMHPMINVYPSKLNRKIPTFSVNGNVVDTSILAPFKNTTSYGKPSKKQIEFGLDPENTVKINNFRFENIRHITMNGTRYQIVAG